MSEESMCLNCKFFIPIVDDFPLGNCVNGKSGENSPISFEHDRCKHYEQQLVNWNKKIEASANRTVDYILKTSFSPEAIAENKLRN